MERKIYEKSEIIELAWDDKVSFDAILEMTGLPEKEVILLMRTEMKPSSFRMWRKRVGGRIAKHQIKLDKKFINEDETEELKD
jgi:uncharacterized protein (TIGR03643 family)